MISLPGQIGAAFDCGQGATCYDFLGTGNGGLVCRCDVNGWLGHDSTGKKAECISAASLTSAAALAKDVEGLKETSKSTTSTLKALAEKSTALVKSANDASSRIENLAVSASVTPSLCCAVALPRATPRLDLRLGL